MNDFLIAIHRDITSSDPIPTPAQMQAAMKPYQDWVAGIGAKGRLVAPPKRWDMDGRVIKQGNEISKGPFVENKQSIGGLFLIQAESYDEAVEIASGCPIIEFGASVEVRMAIPPVQ